MPLDPRLILAAAPPAAPPVDVFGSLQRGLSTAYQMRGNEQQLQAQQLQLAEAQRQEQERGTLARAFRGAVVTDPATGRATLDVPQAFSAAYQTSTNPLAVLKAETEYGKGQAESRKATLEARKAELEQQQEQLAFVSKVANGVLAAVDDGDDPQQAYERGIAQVQQAGLPIQGLPPTFDRGVVMQFAATSQKYQEALQNQQKVIDQQLAEQRLALEGRREQRLERAEGRQERAEGRAETKAQREEREAAAQVPQYTGDSALNVAIDQEMQAAGLPRGQQPPGPVLEKAVQRVQQGKEAVSGAQGAEAARIARTEKPLEGEAAKVVSQIDALQSMTDDVTDLFDPSYTGQFEGRWGAVKQWTGNATTREVVFRNIVKELKNQLLSARSGSAVTPQEYERLNAVMPNVTDPETTFQAKLLSFRRGLDQAKAARLKTATTGRGTLQEQQAPVTPLPAGGGAASPAAGAAPRRYTRQQVEQKLKPGWTVEQAIDYYRSQGIEVE